MCLSVKDLKIYEIYPASPSPSFRQVASLEIPFMVDQNDVLTHLDGKFVVLLTNNSVLVWEYLQDAYAAWGYNCPSSANDQVCALICMSTEFF